MRSATPASQRSHCMSLLSIMRLGGGGLGGGVPQGVPTTVAVCATNRCTSSVVTGSSILRRLAVRGSAGSPATSQDTWQPTGKALQHEAAEQAQRGVMKHVGPAGGELFFLHRDTGWQAEVVLALLRGCALWHGAGLLSWAA